MNTPIRSVRVPEDLWAAAIVKAAQQEITVTQVLIDALRTYVGVKND